MTDPLYPLDLHGRRFLVTGAASGIGLATITLLSRLGGRLVAVDSNEEGLRRAMSNFVGQGHESKCWDLRCPVAEQREALASGTIAPSRDFSGYLDDWTKIRHEVAV